MKNLFLGLIALSLTTGVAMAATPKVIVAKFDAEWCVNCKQMAPAYNQLKKEFGGDEVVFVIFDRTDEESDANSAGLASALGVRDIFDAYDNTGFAVMIDNETKKEIAQVNKSHSFEDMALKLASALGGEMAKGSQSGMKMKEMKSGSEMKGSEKKEMKGSMKGSH